MASSVTIRVDGLRELGERMRALSAKTANKFSGRATGKAAGIVKKAAKTNLKNSPSIESGTLEKNVIMKKLGKTKTPLTSEHIVTVKKRNYADAKGQKRNTRQVGGYVEHGTVNMPAEPYLRPALANNIPSAINAIKDSLAKDILKEGA